ncbi:hypothetical protein BKP37_00760 [Anaerobacillus alkalilacustris]|uniref:FtsK domain-containing protein n=1 Tax=Anaerobacillus alkalilacustris TaxID=393763 RepID=A0A1S2LX49_9BACI|nr:FtsK/SpoIIIE domain-containing protein [Anaerobacillus alkalilacustris]OIJ17102.1 hypothetical protein BKP37_00760 [Anaerobacillus alkalilacustris]
MFFEIGSSVVMAGVAGYTFLYQSGNANDNSKIQRIAANSGLTVKEGKKTRTIQLLRKTKYDWGFEYVYRVPLGLSFSDFQNKRDQLQDGLNNKSSLLNITLDDVLTIDFKKDLLQQLKDLFKEKKSQKEIELFYDGALKIRVYSKLMPEAIEWDETLLEKCKGWKVPIGETRDTFISHDFEKTPHMLVGGSTGGGKSSFLDMVICHLLNNQTENVKFHLIDLKGGVEFFRFKDCKQVVSYAEEPDEALQCLESATNKIKELQETFRKRGVRNCKEAGIKERHFIIIDEIAEISSADEPDKEVKKIKEQCEYHISQIARIGRSQGFRIITATQHPTQDYVPKSVKRNSDARLCFRVRDAVASKVVLDTTGGESLPKVVGRAIYQDKGENTTVQLPYLETGTMDKMTHPHIVIRARKEEGSTKESDKTNGQNRKEGATGGTDTLVIEETELS